MSGTANAVLADAKFPRGSYTCIITEYPIFIGLGNMVCSCCSCNYRSWEGTRVNHIISLSDRWACQLVASE